MPAKSLFIASTGQNVGKTTISLGIFSGIKKIFKNPGFIKPVGQQYLEKDGTIFDKDTLLFKNYFSLSHSFSDISPVILPKGFTKDFLDGKIETETLKKKILTSFDFIYKNSDFVLIEGTGHTGVGSIINLNNAQVAKELNSNMVIVSNAGLGSSFDEIMLNLALCEKEKIQVKGIILNKVLESKKEMILDYYPKALKRLNIPLLGVISYNKFLSLPCMNDFCLLFDTTLFSGSQNPTLHFAHAEIADTPLKLYRHDNSIYNELIITAATREDIIVATLAKYWNDKKEIDTNNLHPGLILTGKTPPRKQLIEKIKKTEIPALYTPMSSFKAMEQIAQFIAKIQVEDTLKLKKAIEVVEPEIDFNKLLY
jgi:phosphate acetyltransferase